MTTPDGDPTSNPAAANVGPLAGLEIPDNLIDLFADRRVQRIVGALIAAEVRQDFIDATSLIITVHEEHRAREAGSAVGATATGAVAETTAAPAETAPSAEVPSDKWFEKYPSMMFYSWGTGDHTYTSESGESLYAAMGAEDAPLQSIGAPPELSEEQGEPKKPGGPYREVIAFSAMPEDETLYEDVLVMPEGTNPDMSLVVVDYEAAGWVPSGPGEKPVLDTLKVQVVLPFSFAARLHASMKKNGPAEARKLATQAFTAELARTKGTAEEEQAIVMIEALRGRYEAMCAYFDRQPSPQAVIASNVDGIRVDAQPSKTTGYRSLAVELPRRGGTLAPQAGPAGGTLGQVVGGLLRRHRG